MTHTKRFWAMVVTLVVVAGSVVGLSALGGADAPASAPATVQQLPLPALDRMVARLAAEARASGRLAQR